MIGAQNRRAALDAARPDDGSVLAVSATHKACEHLKARVAALHERVPAHLGHICDIVNGKAALPEGCPSSAALAEKQLEPLLDELREVYAAAELIRSAIWQDQS